MFLRRFPVDYRPALLIMLASLAVVIAGQRQLSHTKDEPAHIIAGMEWWQEGRYTLEPIHPPLARLVMAAPLYWSGVRTAYPLPPGHKDYFYLTQAGLAILFDGGKYVEHLMLARLALLPFYIVSMAVVFLWSRRLYGVKAALLSLALYATLPPILAHAGLATTDMPYVAMCLLALYLFVRWLERPDAVRSVVLGIALALAVSCKFSAVLHIPVAMAAILAGRCFYRYHEMRRSAIDWRSYGVGLCYAIPMALFYIAAVYRFEPVTPLMHGLHDAYEYNHHGRALWLFGPLYNHAVWYFFPVLLFFKTPLPFLILALVALYAVLTGRDCKGRDPMLAAVAILLASMAGHIDLGIRHILIVYPLLAVPAGQAAMQAILWLRRKKTWLAWPAALLLGWQCFDVAEAFPDYISYYNLLSGAHPERINIDSDFDWGQDMLLLKKALERRHISEVYQCFGTGVQAYADRLLEQRLMPDIKFLSCAPHPSSGWIAASIQLKTIYPQEFTWLDNYEPLEKIGQTLELYHLQNHEGR